MNGPELPIIPARRLEKELEAACATGRFPCPKAAMGRVLKGLLTITGLLSRGRRNANAVSLVEREVALARLPKSFDGYRMLHLSDIHVDQRPIFTDNLVDVLETTSYDACVITGDFPFRRHTLPAACLKPIRRVLQAINAPDGVYAVLGNNDLSWLIPEIVGCGVHVLMNSNQPIRRDGDTLWVCGVDDPHYFQSHDLDAALAAIPPQDCRILLAHSPELAQTAAGHDIDLFLCGHTHWGQIRLPGIGALWLNAQCPRRFCEGWWCIEAMQGFTSPGAGSTALDVRFNCPPEVTFLTLRTAYT